MVNQYEQFKSLTRNKWEMPMSLFLAPLTHDQGVPGNNSLVHTRVEVEGQIISGVGVGTTLEIYSKPVEYIRKVNKEKINILWKVMFYTSGLWASKILEFE